MINFRCPKCNDWLNVPESLVGDKETCPNCGNVCIVPTPSGSLANQNVPPSIETTAQRRVVQPEPRMPDVMKVGLAMYIASFVLGLASGLLGGSLEVSEENAAGLLGMGCLALLLLPADIVGLVMACLGRAWGAILMICTTAVGLILSLASAGFVAGPGIPLYIVSWVLGIASLICFVVPSAWAFYRQSEAYRKS